VWWQSAEPGFGAAGPKARRPIQAPGPLAPGHSRQPPRLPEPGGAHLNACHELLCADWVKAEGRLAL
jgi:hypothetical protein